ncbi:MAG: hypothetical protein ACM3UZ_07210 [Acidobacteriota bacterium]
MENNSRIIVDYTICDLLVFNEDGKLERPVIAIYLDSESGELVDQRLLNHKEFIEMTKKADETQGPAFDA